MLRTAVSNIAWGNVEDEHFLRLAASLGAYGIECAPSVFWEEPVSSSYEERKKYREKVEHYGLKIISLHALLFTRPELKLFDTPQLREQTEDYLVQLGKLAKDLGAGLMILGSPKNRTVGTMDKNEADIIAMRFFRNVAERLEPYEVCLCIEPLCRKECDYITNHSEAIELVQLVNRPMFQMMLDVKSMYLSQEDYRSAFINSAPCLRHIHVNDPGNTVPGTRGVSHELIADALRHISYDGVLSLEIGRSTGTPDENIQIGFQVLNEIYNSRM